MVDNNVMSNLPNSSEEVTITHPLALPAQTYLRSGLDAEKITQKLDLVRRASNISKDETRAYVEKLLKEHSLD